MPTPQAKFEFVATGDAQVNAQVQSVVDKLVQMKQRAVEAGSSMSGGMLSAREDVRAVGEALGTPIARPLAAIIAQFQSLKGVLAGAGIAGGILLGVETAVHMVEKGQEIYDKWLNVNTAIKEYNKQLSDAVTKSAQQVSSLEEADTNLKAATDSMQKYAAQRDKLNSHNKQTDITQDPLDFFLSKSYEKDALTGQLKSSLDIFTDRKNKIEEESKLTDQLITGQKQLNDVRLQGMPKILADEQSDIAAADAKLSKLQHLIQLENDRRAKFNASSHLGVDDLPMIPADAGLLEHSLALYDAHALAIARIGTAARETQTTILSFEDNLAALRNEATGAADDDPYQKELTDLDNFWQAKIRKTMDGGEKELADLRQRGVDTVGLENELDDTLLALQAAYYKKKDDLEKKQQQELLTGGIGANSIHNIPSFLFVTDADRNQATQAKAFIDMITRSLQDETAQENLLKDTASTSGETQLQLDQQLFTQRNKMADQMQQLVASLRAVGAAMHNGLGDPVILAQADKLQAKIDALRVKTQTWATELRKTINQDLENAFVGVVSGTETVSQAFQKMGQDILAMLAKVVYEMYIVKLLQSAIGGLGLGGGGGSDPLGVSAQFGTFGGGRASGGPVLPGMRYNVGENGPETLVMGRQGGMVIPNRGGGSSGGGQMPVQVNIHNYGQPMDMEQSSRFDGTQYIIDVVVKDFQNNGRTRQTFGR